MSKQLGRFLTNENTDEAGCRSKGCGLGLYSIAKNQEIERLFPRRNVRVWLISIAPICELSDAQRSLISA